MNDTSVVPTILRAPQSTQRKLFNVTDFYRMAKAGVFGENRRIELIAGEIFEMSAIGGRHIGAIMALTELFTAAALGRFRVSIQNSLRLDDHSEPEPDVVLLRQRADKYLTDQPPLAVDAVLVIEVADSSLEYDKRVKLPLYARHGIPEYWIVDVDEATIIVCRSPNNDGYGDMNTFKAPACVAALALPHTPIPIADIVAK